MKSEEALKVAKQGLESLAESLKQGKTNTLKQVLEVMARFPTYSFRNVLLILAQRPDAQHIAGFRTWKKLGRHVSKGEKGIGIVAPLVKRKADDSGNPIAKTADESNEARICGFRVVHVFDISQTEGAELPELTRPTGDPGAFLNGLETVIQRLGIALTYEQPTDGALGWSLKGRIIVRSDLEPAERFAVLAHELAHELLHAPADHPRPCKTVRETEAEAVAHAVCQACGIDSTISSVEYIQLYSGNLEALCQSMERIQSATARIVTELFREDMTIAAEQPCEVAA